jgi:glycine cleavage system H lipoate-binding protein
VAREADGSLRVRVGLEPDLARALLVPKAAVLPSSGDRLDRGQVHWWIVTEGGTFPIAAPLAGQVTATNAALAAEPHRVGAPILDEAWAYEMQICDSDLKGARLMRAAEAVKAYGADADRFRDSLAGSIRGDSPEVGPTLADGGIFLQHISDMIGAVKYFGLLRQIYG